MKRPWILGAIAVALAVAVLALLLVDGAPSSKPAAASASAPPRPSPARLASLKPVSIPPLVEAYSSKPRRGKDTWTEPLPPSDSLVASHFPRLREMAFAGDARAACRVSLDLTQCSPRWREAIVARTRNAKANLFHKDYTSEQEHQSLVEYVAALQRALAKRDQVCSGFTPSEDELPIWQYSLAAALGGSVPDMGRFLSNDRIGLDFAYPERTLEGWQAYDRHALQIFEVYKTTGDAGAYMLLGLAYRGEPDFLFGVEHPYKPNPILSYGYLMAAFMRVPGSWIEGLDHTQILPRVFPEIASNVVARLEAETVVTSAISRPSTGRSLAKLDPPADAVPGEMMWAERCEEIAP